MNNFNARWQECAARARGARERETTAPFGFAARVVAVAQSRGSHPSTEEILGRLALRMLVGAVALLILCTLLEARHLRGPQPLETGLEDTVGQLVWAL